MLHEDAKRNPMNDWKYYNHAAIAATPPHITPNIEPVRDGSIWSMPGNPYLVRWTTEFDCGYETQWWYCIKDQTFDIMALPSRKRYKITKGMKRFDVIKIKPEDYIDELLSVTRKAYAGYPKKYRPYIDRNKMKNRIVEWRNSAVFGAFQKETGILCGYIVMLLHDEYAELSVQKADPAYERYGLNAAILNGMLTEFNGKMAEGYYICDGARNISHETEFQSYLGDYFGFRKAYCKLNVRYAKKIAPIVKGLYPLRKMLLYFDRIKICHYVNGVLKMEAIRRSFDQ